MNILAARKYHTPRNGPLTADQAETRRIAYSIKHPGADWTDYDTAAREMAALISGPCWLVPITRPSPTTSLATPASSATSRARGNSLPAPSTSAEPPKPNSWPSTTPTSAPYGQNHSKSSAEDVPEPSPRIPFTETRRRAKVPLMKGKDSSAAGLCWPIIPKWGDRQVCLIPCSAKNERAPKSDYRI